jgi:hypothetical protein
MARYASIGFAGLLALGFGGCNGSTPTAPTQAAAPSVAASPSPGLNVPKESWTVAVTYAGHTGPAACLPPFDATIVQTPITGSIVIQRSGGSIQVITEHDRYVGTVLADVYSATDNDTGTWTCGAATLSFTTEGHASGRFSADGLSLAGEEGVVFRLANGETITRRWEWRGTRQ